MEAEKDIVMPEELPADYALLASPNGRLVWILKNDKALRRVVHAGQSKGFPVWFYAVDKMRAISYAQWHYRLDLTPDQEVPQECL